LPLPRIEAGHPARILVTTLTDLSQLLFLHSSKSKVGRGTTTTGIICYSCVICMGHLYCSGKLHVVPKGITEIFMILLFGIVDES